MAIRNSKIATTKKSFNRGIFAFCSPFYNEKIFKLNLFTEIFHPKDINYDQDLKVQTSEHVHSVDVDVIGFREIP